jgi:hypothetical protein
VQWLLQYITTYNLGNNFLVSSRCCTVAAALEIRRRITVCCSQGNKSTEQERRMLWERKEMR